MKSYLNSSLSNSFPISAEDTGAQLNLKLYQLMLRKTWNDKGKYTYRTWTPSRREVGIATSVLTNSPNTYSQCAALLPTQEISTLHHKGTGHCPGLDICLLSLGVKTASRAQPVRIPHLSTYRVGSREVISSHDFHVRFLYERNPQLTLVVGVRTEQLSLMVNR